jgi:2-dehydropantoate 2-reductase
MDSTALSLPADPFPPSAIRSVLVYGAGVLGSLYAGKLAQAGYAVTLLARGQRLAELRERGLVLVNEASGQVETIAVPLTERLDAQDAYDLVLVVMRRNQVDAVLPVLAANAHTPNVLFMLNNAAGPAVFTDAVSTERVLLGFPGAGGQRVNGAVHYQVTASALQATTIGEVDGRWTARLGEILQMFEAAGFPAAACDNMDAWLKTHAALVSPIANAIYLAGGSTTRLAHTPDGLLLLVRAIKEGLAVLHALHVPVIPSQYRYLSLLPEPLLLAVLRRSFATPRAELLMARHANAARDEMRLLSEQFQELAHDSGIPTPAMDTLIRYIDPTLPPVPEGQKCLPSDWKPLIAAGAALLSAGALAAWLLGGEKSPLKKDQR